MLFLLLPLAFLAVSAGLQLLFVFMFVQVVRRRWSIWLLILPGAFYGIYYGYYISDQWRLHTIRAQILAANAGGVAMKFDAATQSLNYGPNDGDAFLGAYDVPEIFNYEGRRRLMSMRQCDQMKAAGSVGTGKEVVDYVTRPWGTGGTSTSAVFTAECAWQEAKALPPAGRDQISGHIIPLLPPDSPENTSFVTWRIQRNGTTIREFTTADIRVLSPWPLVYFGFTWSDASTTMPCCILPSRNTVKINGLPDGVDEAQQDHQIAAMLQIRKRTPAELEVIRDGLEPGIHPHG